MKKISSTIKNYFKNHRGNGLIPLEATSTIPLPVFFKEQIFLTFFYYVGKRLNKNEKIKLYSPSIKLLIKHPTSKIIFYQNLIFLNSSKENKWEEPIGEFPHEQVESMTLKEYKEKKEELYFKYDKLMDLKKNKKNDQKFKSEFNKLFYQLCEPCFLPLLKKSNKNFFSWIDDI